VGCRKKTPSSFKTISTKLLGRVHTKMLDFVEWFNKTACGDTSSALANVTLLLRKVLSQGRYILDVNVKNEGMNIWLAYAHWCFLDAFGWSWVELWSIT